jgi:hypothetical protein
MSAEGTRKMSSSRRWLLKEGARAAGEGTKAAVRELTGKGQDAPE